MKKTITLWSLYIFSLVVANMLQAGNGNPWDPRGENTDQVNIDENQEQPTGME